MCIRDSDERRGRQVAQVVIAQRNPGEQRMLGREVPAEGEPGDDPEVGGPVAPEILVTGPEPVGPKRQRAREEQGPCLLYTSDAADDLTRVDLGGRRIIKK